MKGSKKQRGFLREMQSQQLSLDSKHALVITNYESTVGNTKRNISFQKSYISLF